MKNETHAFLERHNLRSDEPSVTYLSGIATIADERGVSYEEAARILIQDLEENESTEHIEPMKAALKVLVERRDKKN